jgi:peptidoglycan/LPS O-acetylase OafA/YrhL
LSNTATLKTDEFLNTTRLKRFYRPELDCLRFFAFFGVYIFHTLSTEPAYYAERHVPFGGIIASATKAGSFGVDLFFLLSAYLITELLLRERDEVGSIHLKSFYLRRILRIWPLYFFALALGVVLSWVDPEQPFTWKYIVAFLLLSGNWLTSLVGFPGSVVSPLWSVSFEEQFYLFWPTILTRLHRTGSLLATGIALLVTAELGRVALLHYARQSEVAIFTNTMARLDPLAFGMMTAVLLRNRQFYPSWLVRLSCLVAGSITWLIAGHYYHMSLAFILLGYPAMALGAWFLFISVLGIRVAPYWLRYLGKISYGLYVFHRLALYTVVKLEGAYPHDLLHFVLYWCLGILLTFAMAAVSYRFLESPFLRLKDRLAYVKSRPV